MSARSFLSRFTVPARTALIPLVARAQARTLFPELGFVDKWAEHIVDALGIPLNAFGSDMASLRGAIIRAKWFDARCKRFFDTNPDGLGVALGAGLDTRYQRLNIDGIHWVDIDLPEMVAMKSRFTKATPYYRILSCDVTDLAWMDRIGWETGTPLILTAEGLLMYLAPNDVRNLFHSIAVRCSIGSAPVAFLFDYASPFLALNSWLHPALARAGAHFRWGLAGAGAVRLFDPRYEVVDDYDIMRDCGHQAAFVSLLHRSLSMGHPIFGLAHVELCRT
jgi:O-methyltransferase involved in polyketide biosynthesis